MIGAVIGLGPRTGTSFVMKQLYEHGFAIYWEEDDYPDSDRVGGHFETPVERLPAIEGRIVKVWPGSQHLQLIERAVILSRDYESQRRSIERQIEREGNCPYDPDFIIEVCYAAMRGFNAPALHVRTDTLNERIDDIFEFFREGLYHAHRSDHRQRHRGCRYWC